VRPPKGVTLPVSSVTGWPSGLLVLRLLSTLLAVAGCAALIRDGREPKDKVH
jgi:hypothetical protein